MTASASAPLIQLHHADCVDLLRSLPANSLDAGVTDAPYGLSAHTTQDIIDALRAWLDGQPYVPQRKLAGFMGRSWDAFVPGPELWREVYRVLKPGAPLAVFAGTRTADLMGIALRLAGFEVRDTLDARGLVRFATLQWSFGKGFPKCGDLGKMLDTAAGAERPVVGPSMRHTGQSYTWSGVNRNPTHAEAKAARTAPVTPEAIRWTGWSSQLKALHEPILLVRKPLDGPLIESVPKWGTGALNIAACRLGFTSEGDKAAAKPQGRTTSKARHVGAEPDAGRDDARVDFAPESNEEGRWPPNVLQVHLAARPVQGHRCPACQRTWEVPPVDLRQGFRAGDAPGTCPTCRAALLVPAPLLVGGCTQAPDGAWTCTPGCVAAGIDQQSGWLVSGKGNARKRSGADREGNTGSAYGAESRPAGNVEVAYGDAGGASRFYPAFGYGPLDYFPFFYAAKPGDGEKSAGCGALVQAGRKKGNTHVSVKPVALMEWLLRLLVPAGGTVLDPLVGSGTTLVAAARLGVRAIGIEREAEYVEIARARLAHAEAEAGRRRTDPRAGP